MANVAVIEVELDLDAGTFSGKVANAGVLIRRLDGDLGKAATSLKRIEDRATSFSASLRGLVTTIDHTRGAIRGIWDVTGGWAKDIADTGGKLERLQVLMRGLSHETDPLKRQLEATKGFDFLTNIAQHAPFQLEALTDAFVKMKTAGVDPMDGSLKALADSVAKFGGDSTILHHASIAIQQMAGKGVVSMEELRRQLGEAVPDAIQRMADGLGLSMAELVKKISTGTVEAKTALQQMFFQMKLYNDGAAEDMMKTWTGMTARLETQMQLVKKQIFEAGFGDALKQQVDKISDALNSNAGKELAEQIGEGLAETVDKLAEFFDFLRRNWDTIKTTGELLLTAFVATKITNGIVGVGKALSGMISNFRSKFAAAMEAIDAKYMASMNKRALLLVEADKLQKGSVAAQMAAEQAKIRYGEYAAAKIVAAKTVEANVAAQAAAAFDAEAVAVGRAATAARVAGAAMEIALGPIGWITLALTVGISAWLEWGNQAEDSVHQAVEAARKGFATLQDLNQINEDLTKKMTERKRLQDELNKGVVQEWVNVGGAADGAQRLVSRLMTGDELAKKTEEISDLTMSIRELKEASTNAGKQVQDEGIRDEVNAYTRGLNDKLGELARANQKELIETKDQLQKKLGASKEYDKQWTDAQREIAGKRVKEQTDLAQSELDALQAQYAKMTNVNSNEAKKISAEMGAVQQKLDELKSDAKSAAGIGNGVFLTPKGGKKPSKTQQAWNDFLTNLAAKTAKAEEEAKGLNGEWEKFQALVNHGKFGTRSKAEIDEAHTLIDAYTEVSAKAKQAKRDANDLANMGDAQHDILARLTADLQSARDNVTDKDIYSSATRGVAQFNRQLAIMEDLLKRTGHENDQLGKNLGQFKTAGLNTLVQTDAINFGQEMIDIQKRNAAAMISNDKERAQAELKIEIDRIQKTIDAQQKLVDDIELSDEARTAAAGAQAKARMAIASLEAKFAYDTRPQWEKLLDGWQDLAKGMDNAMSNAMSNVTDAMAEMVVTGKADFKSLAEGIEKEIVKVMLNKLVAQFVMSFMGGMGGGGVDSAGFDESGWYSGYAKGGVMSPAGDVPLKKYARGGIATRPQMALYGEGSMNEAFVPLPDGRRIPVDMRNSPAQPAQTNVQVNVINQSGHDVQAKQKGGPRFDGKQMILDVVLSATNSPGTFRDGMKAGLLS